MYYNIFVPLPANGPTKNRTDKMSSPEPATFAIVAIQIAECVGDADNMSFFVTLQHFGQSFSQ